VTGSPDSPAEDSRPDLPPDEPGLHHRLDPESAAALAGTADRPGPPPVVDTRRYRWMIGVFGLALVLVISVYQFAAHGVGTVGIPAGRSLHNFAAPLATSTLSGDANLNPPCSIAKHDPRALNTCLLVSRAPLVLAFFVTGSSDCDREVDTMQALSRQFAASAVQFAAVAVRGAHAETAAVVHSHRWSIPVAYDRDGAVGAFFGVETCPIVELAYRGGRVADRLIGNHWLSRPALAAKVQALVAHRL
jgi:thiol-disulfide isomerase/thioredoxin